MTAPEGQVTKVLHDGFSLNETEYEILGQGSYGIVIRECVDIKYCLKLDLSMNYGSEDINDLLSSIRDTSQKLLSDTSKGFANPDRTVRIFNEINRELIDSAVIEQAQVVTFHGSKVVRLPLLTPISRDDSEERDQAYTAMISRCIQIYRDFGRIIPDIVGSNNAMWSDDTDSRQLVFNDIPNSYRRGSFAGLNFFNASSPNLPNNIFNGHASYWQTYVVNHHCKKLVIKILIGLIVYDYDKSQAVQAIQAPGGELDLEKVALKHYESLFNEVCKCAKPSNQYSYLDDCAWRKLRELMRKLNPDAPRFTESEKKVFVPTKKLNKIITGLRFTEPEKEVFVATKNLDRIITGLRYTTFVKIYFQNHCKPQPQSRFSSFHREEPKIVAEENIKSIIKNLKEAPQKSARFETSLNNLKTIINSIPKPRNNRNKINHANAVIRKIKGDLQTMKAPSDEIEGVPVTLGKR